MTGAIIPGFRFCRSCGKYFFPVKSLDKRAQRNYNTFSTLIKRVLTRSKYAGHHRRGGACGVRSGAFSGDARRARQARRKQTAKVHARALIQKLCRAGVQQLFEEQRRVRQRLRPFKRGNAPSRLAHHAGGGSFPRARGRCAGGGQGRVFRIRYPKKSSKTPT